LAMDMDGEWLPRGLHPDAGIRAHGGRDGGFCEKLAAGIAGRAPNRWNDLWTLRIDWAREVSRSCSRGMTTPPVLSAGHGRTRGRPFTTEFGREERMFRLIAVAVFGLALASSAQALTPAPLHQPDGMITQVAYGCGPGRTIVAGRCVARTTIRHTRRVIRRCARWRGDVCLRYY
jgi:hypothetical protein